ncbi:MULTISPECIES: hypothetical protein [Flavobacterium]|uniref:Uncharacterized protein n=1 Tax=Flavobacterium jumunjinense TaxID=998845 RepID=A0ABV5GSE2_9FLAO|nr:MULTISPECIES: hypothetical protein [Flavobacterium]
MLKRYKIRKQNNQIGYHAGFEIDVSFKKKENSSKNIVIHPNSIQEWKASTIEGINIFYESYKNEFQGDLTIKIRDIIIMPVDTKEIIVTYTIVRTLCHWFQLDYLPILKQAKFESLFFLNEFDFRTDDETSFYI